MAAPDPFPLLQGWTKTTRSGVLHAISLAFTALIRAWGLSATSRRRTIRVEADLDRAMTEIDAAGRQHPTIHFPRRPG